MADILPNSLPRERTVVEGRHDLAGRIGWLKIFCANCGADGGFIPEQGPKFAFYLCPPCGEKWSPLVGTMLTPDEAFWRLVEQEQMEQYGRELAPEEVVEVLQENTSLAKLAKDRKE